MARAFQIILIMLFTVSVPSASQAQTTWHVDDDCVPPGTGTEVNPFCTIQDGVDASDDGDTVEVRPGTYTGSGNRDISMFGKGITLKSSDGPSATTIDIQGGPSSIHRGFFLTHGETCKAVIDGFMITNGYLIGDTGGSGPLGGGGGAGIYIRDSSPSIRNCIIKFNISDTLGIPLLVDGRGAGIYVDGNSRALVEDCVIVNNASQKRGGGVYVGYELSTVEFGGCLIAENVAGGGGGMYFAFGNHRIVGTTIAFNESGGGGGIISSNSSPLLANCILWENVAPSGPQILATCAHMPTIEYSDVQGGFDDIVVAGCKIEVDWGPGNLDADPLFVDSEIGDYHLLAGSPCIDAGNNLTALRDRAVDLDGRGRFADDPGTSDTGNPGFELPIVDMGAYEFGPEDCNTNNIDDADDITAGDSADCDENGVPDECQTDCNTNNQADVCDIAEGGSLDCNCNRIPDDCEADCNNTGQPDDCDVADGTSEDCNDNNDPDECEEDCNKTGQPDDCDVADGTSEDCNFNEVPDECEITIPIFAQPQDQAAEVGELVLISVGVEAFQPDYQWRKDGVDLQDDDRIVGSQSSTLIIFDVIPEDAGEYDCFIVDLLNGCENTSDSATLTVHGPCPADFDNDGAVAPFDLAILLDAWGLNPNHPADLNNDGQVGPTDLALLLGAWGPCP